VAGQSTPPDGVYGQRRISSGYYHTCGLQSNGTLACWGSNSFGEIIPPNGLFTQVSTGRWHTCGIKSDGILACWGYDIYGQSTPPVGTFTRVSAGGWHTCGIKSNGALACWGMNDYGQATPPNGTYRQVSAGLNYTCGLKTDGTLACWGQNIYGEAMQPVGVFTQISARDYHACGIKSDGTLACWGANPDGESSPLAGIYRQVSAGSRHTCGIKSDGMLSCWGNNEDGQASPPALRFTQVSAGSQHTCGIRNNGTLTCWGSNLYYQSPRLSISPTSLPDGSEGAPYAHALVASGGTALYSFSWAAGSLPPGLSLSSAGLLSGTPTAGGTYTFTIQAADSSFPISGSQDYTLWINSAPVAVDQSLSTPEDTSSNGAVTATDADGDTLFYSGTGATAHGSVVVNSGGTFIYTPGLNYHGSDSFPFTVSDGHNGTDAGTVSITVTPVNDAPVAAALDDVVWLAHGQHEIVIPAFTDVDGDLLTYTASLSGGEPLPAWLSFNGGARIFNGTPANADKGEYFIIVTASDGSLTASGTFTLTVMPQYLIYLPLVVN
jgi:hypothetical protein